MTQRLAGIRTSISATTPARAKAQGTDTASLDVSLDERLHGRETDGEGQERECERTILQQNVLERVHQLGRLHARENGDEKPVVTGLDISHFAVCGWMGGGQRRSKDTV
jgi:hypothetical protein